jgi:hypothetical protein
MKKIIAYLFVSCLCLHLAWGAKKYVSTTGTDSNGGTLAAPYATIAKAYSNISAQDTIYVLGGTYTMTSVLTLSSKGGADTSHYTCIFAYSLSSRPVLDFSSMALSSSNYGISLSASYYFIKGIQVKGAGDNGIHVTGSYNKVEFCSFFENRDAGVQIGGGAAYNKFINCDSYFNCDTSQGNADGFSPKLDVGTGNYFYGCRSWQNSDDGWDGYLRGADSVCTTLENCWCFSNGYLKSGAASSGNGNGFKNGGGDKVGTVSNGDSLRHYMTLKNCLSFCNRVKGYDQNNNRGTMKWINCSAYNNGTYNYSCPVVLRVKDSLIVINCISVGSSGTSLSTSLYKYRYSTDSWLSPFSTPATSDFQSLDTTGVRGPRQADGSLPDVAFMHLSSTSQFLDAGTMYSGISFYDTKPDLGCFEYSSLTPVQLTSFAATVASNSSVLLSWNTATEVNNYGFEIERRTVGSLSSTTTQSEWTKIGFVTGNGTSSIEQNYSYTDANAVTGTYVYRLKQIDNDGAYKYSSETEVKTGTSAKMLTLSNYPNPFNPTTTIQFTVPNDGNAVVKVFNVLGQEVVTAFSGEVKAGVVNTISFNASKLSSGVYFSRLESGGKAQIRKLVLMK